MTRRLLDRIEGRSVREDRGYVTECLIFTGAKDTCGYGQIRDGRTTARTHRVMYQANAGLIPFGFELDHLCRQRDCCDHRHLEVVTHVENVRRGRVSDSNRLRGAEVTHCPQGHAYTLENTRMSLHRSGTYGRACKTCQRERNRLYRSQVAS